MMIFGLKTKLPENMTSIQANTICILRELERKGWSRFSVFYYSTEDHLTLREIKKIAKDVGYDLYSRDTVDGDTYTSWILTERD